MGTNLFTGNYQTISIDYLWFRALAFQYRAAVSSAQSTPSKSFVLPSGSSMPANDVFTSPSHHQPTLPMHAYALQQKQRSFLTFGFGAGGSGPSRRESHINVNVTPTTHEATSDTPEIRKYKKRFNSEILCAALWGVNLLIGTENGLMLLDRSGQGKVYQLISRRRFQQMEVLEGQNILVTISGKKNRVRVYYLSWLKSKILRTDGLSDVRINLSKVTNVRVLTIYFFIVYSKWNGETVGLTSETCKVLCILK